MRTLHRLIPSTRGACRRALILSLYIAVLVGALSWQAHQFRADTVYVYVQGDVAYAQALSDSQPLPLFPLADECRFRWTNGTDAASATRDEMAYAVNSDDWLLPNHRNPVRKPVHIAQHPILAQSRISDAVSLAWVEHQLHRRLSDSLHRLVELDALLR